MYNSGMLSLQAVGKEAKKAIAGDEWRKGSVEERLEYSLVKVDIYMYMYVPYGNIKDRGIQLVWLVITVCH